MRSASEASAPRSTIVTILGMVLAALGLIIQWVVRPATFAHFGFPPGLIYIIGTGVIIWVFRRSNWSPATGVTMGLWILLGGLIGGDLQQNLASGDTGVVLGNLVMAGGLALSVVAGIGAVALNRRRRPQSETTPLSPRNPRRLAFIITAIGLFSDALGDALPEGFDWDGLGPMLFLALSIAVLLVPGRSMAALTSLICFAFLGGAFSSEEFVARLTARSQVLPFIGAYMQIFGLIIAMIVAVVAVLPTTMREKQMVDVRAATSR